ncbi:DUF5590 domain-containing protein [Sporosarcina jiandibaonis]|uniref:cell wall elongation regulator TseB-like domain-containing protein n=1 Tax=Sporosarcina jiandibaonis TaxID=2715535 RepID=UPI0015548051|nr:DUF5590 domain-containing protein [Sporosarcina jiandibaonis]
MLNWIKFITVFLIALATIIVITVFYNANKPLAVSTEAAAKAALESGQLVSVNSVQPYNGAQAFMVVFGIDENGEEIAVFVDDYAEDGFKSLKVEDGITAKEAIQTVREELTIAKVLHVSLGIEEEEPVWEVAFTGENGKLNYVYVFFESGQWWKRILNL